MVQTAATAWTGMPAPVRAAVRASSSRAAVTPRRQPMPTVTIRGTIQRMPGPGSVKERAALQGASPVTSSTPLGGVPAMGQSLRMRRGLPASSAAEKALIRLVSGMAQPWARAQSSTGNTPPASVAVVTTGTAPQAAAICRARALAPPRWPDTRGTAKCPCSSMATTAGSLSLAVRWGATARTAMPQAPTYTSPAPGAKCSAVQPARVTGPPQRTASPPRASARRRARASPRPLKAR